MSSHWLRLFIACCALSFGEDVNAATCEVLKNGAVTNIDCPNGYCCEEYAQACCEYDTKVWYSWWIWIGIICAAVMLLVLVGICCYYVCKSQFCQWMCWSSSYSSSHIKPLLLRTDTESNALTSPSSGASKTRDDFSGIYRGFHRDSFSSYTTEESSSLEEEGEGKCNKCWPFSNLKQFVVEKLTQRERASLPWDDEEAMMIPGAKGRRRLGRPIHWTGNGADKSPYAHEKQRPVENVDVPTMIPAHTRRQRKVSPSSHDARSMASHSSRKAQLEEWVLPQKPEPQDPAPKDSMDQQVHQTKMNEQDEKLDLATLLRSKGDHRRTKREHVETSIREKKRPSDDYTMMMPRKQERKKKRRSKGKGKVATEEKKEAEKSRSKRRKAPRKRPQPAPPQTCMSDSEMYGQKRAIIEERFLRANWHVQPGIAAAIAQLGMVPIRKHDAIRIESKQITPISRPRRYTSCLDSREASRIVQTLRASPRRSSGAIKKTRKDSREREKAKYPKRYSASRVSYDRSLPSKSDQDTASFKSTVSRSKSDPFSHIPEPKDFAIMTQSSSDEDDEARVRKKSCWYEVMMPAWRREKDGTGDESSGMQISAEQSSVVHQAEGSSLGSKRSESRTLDLFDVCVKMTEQILDDDDALGVGKDKQTDQLHPEEGVQDAATYSEPRPAILPSAPPLSGITVISDSDD